MQKEEKLSFVQFKFLSVLYENNFNGSYTHQHNWLEKGFGKSTISKQYKKYKNYIEKEGSKYHLKDEYMEHIRNLLKESGYKDEKNHPRIHLIIKKSFFELMGVLLFIIIFGGLLFVSLHPIRQTAYGFGELITQNMTVVHAQKYILDNNETIIAIYSEDLDCLDFVTNETFAILYYNKTIKEICENE